MSGRSDGLVVVDKPAGCTSHDVVARCRQQLGGCKAGHAGTLDPMATGVLLVGVGRATRLLGHLAGADKAYDATIRLGVTTTTDDAEGATLATVDPSAVTDAAIAAAITVLTGATTQVPSSVSAIKVDGVRAYARVRAGGQVALAARSVTISRFELLARRGRDLDVRVECSTGTYVRALARDLGGAVGVGGHLTALRRTRVGHYVLADAVALTDVAGARLISLGELVGREFARRDVDADEARIVGHGGRLPPIGKPGLYGVFGPGGEVVALVEERDGPARPLVVFVGG